MSTASSVTRPPVILQVLPALETGGVERGTVDMALAIQHAGWVPVVASTGGRLVAELERHNILHLTLPLRSKSPLTIRRNIDRLRDVIYDYRVNLVHARSRAPAWSAYYAAKREGVPFVTTYHGTYNGGLWGLKDRYNAIMTRGARVIAISQFIADHIIRTHGTPSDIIRVIPRGVDIDSLNPATISQNRVVHLVQKWQLADRLGVPVVMLPGRLTRWKGQEVLIAALAHRQQRGDLCCLLVGSDQGRHQYSAALREQITRNSLHGMVHLVGECADMPAAYLLSDLVISASTDPEAFGRVVVEGQAMGRPVIATNHGAAAETVLDGQTGVLIPPNDPVALAAAIDHLVALSPDQRRAVAQAGRAHVAAHFTKAMMCERTLAVYEELLSGHVNA